MGRELHPVAQPVERVGFELHERWCCQPHPGVAIDHVGNQIRQPRGIQPAAWNVGEVAGPRCRKGPRYPLGEQLVEQRLVRDTLFGCRFAEAAAEIRRAHVASGRLRLETQDVVYEPLDGGVAHAPHLVGREFQVGEVRGHRWQLYNEERSHRVLGRLPLARFAERQSRLRFIETGRVAMLLTGHKSRAIFDRYNIININEQELLDAGDQLVAYLVPAGAGGASPSATLPDRHRRPAPRGRPSASRDAPPHKGAPPRQQLAAADRGGGGSPDTARLCAGDRVQAHRTGQPAIAAHMATGRPDAADPGHAPSPTEAPRRP